MSGSDRMSPAGSGRWAVAPAQAQVSQALREVAAEAGCAFWHTIDNMGGTGSADKWARLETPLAKRDRVHLTESGYRGLARRLVKDLLDAFGKTEPEPAASR
jgi:lysophospholipase L1-like esterase